MAALRTQADSELQVSASETDGRVAQLRAQADMLRNSLSIPKGCYELPSGGGGGAAGGKAAAAAPLTTTTE